MRRPIQILLVLMGGGLVAGAAVSLLAGDNCPPEDPNCSTGSGRSGYSSSTSYSSGSHSTGGHSSGSAGAVAGAAAGAAVGTAVARGGFGSSGSHYSSSSGG